MQSREVPVQETARDVARTPDPVVTASLTRGKHPRPGVQVTGYTWRDLVDGPPPRKRRRGGGSHATYHGEEIGEDVRLAYTTLVRVDPGADVDSHLDDTVFVDERISVQRRALHELIDRERAFTDRIAMHARAGLTRSLVRQRARANSLGAKWAIQAMVFLIKLQAKVGFASIRAMRAILRGVVRVPDTIVTRTQVAQTHLSNRYGRRLMRNGLRDPGILTNEQKSVVFFVTLSLLALTLTLAAALFTFFFPAGSNVFSRMVVDGTLSLLSILALPIPNEPLLINSTIAYGPIVAFAGSFAGKMIGVWLLFFLGDSLFTTVQKATSTKPRLKRLVDWMSMNSNRYGFWLLIPVNAIPLIPDVLLYAFAVSGMRYKPYMLGIALGTTLKFGAIVVGVSLLGPDRVLEFLTHPWPR